MVKFWKKENRASSALSAGAKRERLVYYLIASGLFVLGSFLLFELLYDVCNIIGSIVSKTPSEGLKQLKRMLPLMLFTVAIVHFAISLRCAYRAKNEGGRVATFAYNGWISVGFGGAIILYIVVGLITGEYAKLVEGYPSLLFPLDLILCGAALIANGVFVYLYSRKLKEKPSELPYRVDERNKHLRRADNVFYTIAYLIVSFSFASLCYTPFVMDFCNGYIFFNVMMIMVHLTAVASFAFYVFAYGGLQEGSKAKAQREYAIVWLIVNALVWILYVVSLQLFPDAPNLNAFGLLPIEYTASVNAFMYIYLLHNIAAPTSALLKTCIGKKKEK